MTRQDDKSDWLEAALGDLRDAEPISDAFMAQLTADALAAQPFAPPEAQPLPFWRQVVDVLGGWGGLGGLAAATCAGLAIGLTTPESVEAAMQSVLTWSASDTSSDFDPVAFGWDLEEG